jgi:hypothetical protein
VIVLYNNSIVPLTVILSKLTRAISRYFTQRKGEALTQLNFVLEYCIFIFEASCPPTPADCHVPPVGCAEKHRSRWWIKSTIFKATCIVSAYQLRGEKRYFSHIMGPMGAKRFGSPASYEWWRCTGYGNFTGGWWIEIQRLALPSRRQRDYWTAALRCPLEHNQRIKYYQGKKNDDIHMNSQMILCYSASLISGWWLTRTLYLS